MTITKPFTFAAGTKARANEVNTDFDVLYSQVNANISDIASLSNEISGLDLTKADVNGSALNTFAVKDPVNSSDAVNKGYLESHTITADYLGSHAVMLTGNQTVNGAKYFQPLANVDTPITTQAITKNANGCLKMGNGIIIQWGEVAHFDNGDVQKTTVTFSTPFTNGWTYQAVASWTMMPKVGDKGFCWAITNKSSTNMVIWHETASSQHQSGTVYWIAIGY